MMKKRDRAKSLGIVVAIVWLIALHAAVQPVVMGNTASDEQSTSLKGNIEGQFSCPMSIPASIETDLDIKFSLQGTVTFTDPTGDVQTLITDELSGSSVSSEYSIAMDEVGAYTIAEELKLSIEAENALLSSYLESLAQEEEFNRNWEYENETAGEKTYTLSSRISDLDIQLSSEHLKALPKDEDTITITVEQTIPAETLVGYIIEYSAQWTKESSIAADVDREIQPNQPPVLDPIPDTEVIIGQDLEIVVSATDPDPGDTLTYSAVGEPTNMGAQLDDNVFTWQPMDDMQVGDYEVTFRVEDPAGGYDEKTATISVIGQEDAAPDDDGQPGDEPAGKGKGQEKPGKSDKKDDEPDEDDIDDQEPGKPEDRGNKPDAHVNLRLDDDSVKFRGGIPSFPAGDVEAVFELLRVLDLEGELNGIDYSLRTEITALYVEEDQMGGTLTLDLYLSSGDTEIAEPGLECSFELTRRKDNFRLDIEGEGLLFHDLAIKVIGDVSEDGVVTAPVVHVDIKYGEEILEAVNVIPFEAVIQSFDLSDFPDEIVLPPGSFAGIEYSATLLLPDLRAKIVENRNKTQIMAGADVGVSLMINGIQVEDILKSRFNLTVIRGKFRLELRGNGSMLKINLNINADVADDGMIISPQVKLEMFYRQEGLPRGDTSPEGEEPEVETPETIEEIAGDVKEAAEEATEAAQEAAEATGEQAAEAVKKAIKAAEKVAKAAEKALQKAEKAAEKAGEEKTEEAEQAAVEAEATAQEATFAALIAASNAAKAAERVAENTEKAAEAAKKAMEKGGLGARRAAEDALTAAGNAAKQVAEAAQVVAANAQRAAENAAKAAEKAAKKAEETRDPQDQEAAQEAAEEAQEAAEEAAEIAQEAAEEAASAAAGAAENAALTAETDALEADEAAAEAAKTHAKEAQRLARKATANARKAEEKAEKATEEAQLALEKAAEAADEASRLAAERAEEAAERAKEAAEKAYQAARRAGREATDLNDDGKNDIRDLMTVIAALGKRFTSLDEEDAMKDINGDGIVDITDLVLTVQGLMGGMPIPATEEGGVAAAPSANANTNVRLEINQRKSDASSNTIRVDLMADSIQDLYAFQFELLFDPDALEVAEVEEGDLLGSDGAETYWHSPGVDVSSSGKTIRAACTRIASEGVSEAGVLATVTFKAKGDSCRSANPLKAGRVKIADARGDAVESGLELKGLDFAKVLMPRSPKLLQNYPNPFNPETWIPYELATDATVTIRIYNTSGQLVRQLDLGSQKAGSYVGKDEAACWDGRNEAGEQVASGVYFYHIQAGSFSATKKMAIVK
jgi:hypothetical protein